MIEEIKRDLGSNYHESDDAILDDLISHFKSIASQSSNRAEEDKLLEPHIITAVKSAYLRRGDEGSTSSNEGGLSASYVDIEKKIREDVFNIRIGRF